MDFERELTLNDYINIIKRRLPYVVVISFIFFLGFLGYAIWLPPTYKSSATILIESQHVYSDEAREKFATDRFAKLNQVVLSKDNLIKIATKYKLYGLSKKSDISQEQLYSATRGNIIVERLKAEPEGWESSTTFAFNVSFLHYDAEETYKIANDIVNLFLTENDRVSKDKAFETEEFFSKEEEKRRIELEKIESKVTNYKRQYSDSLPENKEIYVASLERLENDLRANQLEYRATKSELRALDVSLESAKAGVGINNTSDRVTGPNDLDGLKLELAKLKSIYSDNHPSVRALQRRVDALENNSPATSKNGNPVSTQSIMVAKVQAQIDTANDRLESLKAEEASIRAKISQSEHSVMRSAQTEGALGALLREYDSAKTAYADIKAKLDNSKIAKNIEIENKGERFVLLEAPVLPESPIKPNRKLIIFVGLFLSIAGAISSAVMIDMFNKGVRGVDAIASIMKIQPIAAIPYITTKAEVKRKKYLVYYLLLGILVVILLTCLIVHLFVMPLDVLISKITARF
jgi:succinoglycan biosynthesis transport protein ExoP